MNSQYRILLAAAATCALLSVVTTVGIHAFISGPSTFEESLEVYKTPYYIFSKWWVILHCLFVVIAVYGLSVCLSRSAFSRLGLVFYTAFGFAEVFRMLLALHYLGTLRDSYLAADPSTQAVIRVSLDSFFGISSTLFAAFTLFILLGNLFIGIAALSGVGMFRYLGYALLIWAFVLCLSLINIYLNNGFVESTIHYFSLTIQPVIRLLIAFVLFKACKENRESTWNTVVT